MNVLTSKINRFGTFPCSLSNGRSNSKFTSLNLKIYKDFDTSPKRAVGNVGLFPFPRVGRSDPEMSEWESPLSYNSFENYDGKVWSLHCLVTDN